MDYELLLIQNLFKKNISMSKETEYYYKEKILERDELYQDFLSCDLEKLINKIKDNYKNNKPIDCLLIVLIETLFNKNDDTDIENKIKLINDIILSTNFDYNNKSFLEKLSNHLSCLIKKFIKDYVYQNKFYSLLEKIYLNDSVLKTIFLNEDLVFVITKYISIENIDKNLLIIPNDDKEIDYIKNNKCNSIRFKNKILLSIFKPYIIHSLDLNDNDILISFVKEVVFNTEVDINSKDSKRFIKDIITLLNPTLDNIIKIIYDENFIKHVIEFKRFNNLFNLLTFFTNDIEIFKKYIKSIFDDNDEIKIILNENEYILLSFLKNDFKNTCEFILSNDFYEKLDIEILKYIYSRDKEILYKIIKTKNFKKDLLKFLIEILKVSNKDFLTIIDIILNKENDFNYIIHLFDIINILDSKRYLQTLREKNELIKRYIDKGLNNIIIYLSKNYLNGFLELLKDGFLKKIYEIIKDKYYSKYFYYETLERFKTKLNFLTKDLYEKFNIKKSKKTSFEDSIFINDYKFNLTLNEDSLVLQRYYKTFFR